MAWVGFPGQPYAFRRKWKSMTLDSLGLQVEFDAVLSILLDHLKRHWGTVFHWFNFSSGLGSSRTNHCLTDIVCLGIILQDHTLSPVLFDVHNWPPVGYQSLIQRQLSSE